jgi:hypothetical protein
VEKNRLKDKQGQAARKEDRLRGQAGTGCQRRRIGCRTSRDRLPEKEDRLKDKQGQAAREGG